MRKTTTSLFCLFGWFWCLVPFFFSSSDIRAFARWNYLSKRISATVPERGYWLATQPMLFESKQSAINFVIIKLVYTESRLLVRADGRSLKSIPSAIHWIASQILVYTQHCLNIACDILCTLSLVRTDCLTTEPMCSGWADVALQRMLFELIPEVKTDGIF